MLLLRSHRAGSSALLLILVAGSVAQADDRIWDQPAFGTFGFGTSWLGGVPPTVGDRAVFGHTLTTTFNPITCQFLESAECASMFIESGNYSFIFANPGVDVHLSGDVTGFGSGDLVVGDRLSAFDPGLSPSASLTMAFDGQFTAHGISVGWGGSGFGSRASTLNIDGAGTRVVSRVGMVVGGAIPNSGKSASVVNISNGASLRTADVGGGNYVNGTVNVSGAGSRWDNNGQLSMGGTTAAPAQLNISNGGYGRVGYIAIIGGDENGPASVGVSGAGSLFDVTAGIWLGNGNGTGTGTLTVADGGRVQVDSDVSVGRGGSAGFLNIESGGLVQSGFGFVGCFQNAPGLARINGVGSRWDMIGGPIVGRESSGRVEILGGGAMNLGGGMTVGDFADVTGEVLVQGADSTLTSTSGWVVLGNAGNGSLTIENLGRGNVAGLVLAAQRGSTGTLTVRNQGRLDITGDVSIGEGAGSSGGSAAAGNLVVEGNSQVTTEGRMYIGRFNDSQGTATIRGGGSRLTVNEELWLGDSGASRGTLAIESGATLSVAQNMNVAWGAAGVESSLTLTGVGTTATIGGQLAVGHSGDSRGLITLNPGTALTAGSLVLGYSSGTTGRVLSVAATPDLTTLHVTGDATIGWDGTGYLAMNGRQKQMTVDGTVYIGRGTGSGDLFLVSSSVSAPTHTFGTSGSDSLVVDRGNLNVVGRVQSLLVRGDTRLATQFDAAGNIRVDGQGDSGTRGTTTFAGNVAIGERGAGTLTVTNRAQVEVGGIITTGTHSAATGAIIVQSNASLAGNVIQIGCGDGAGSLTVASGGRVRAFDVAIGASTSSGLNSGTALVSGTGSLLTVDSALYLGTLGHGTLDVSDGGRVVSNGDFEVRQGGRLQGHGGIIDGVVVNLSGGVIAPGHSAGELTINGLLITQGLLQMEIGGGTAGVDFDHLNVLGGGVSLGGTLELFGINGFVPFPGQTFDLINAPHINGAFTSIIDHTSFGFMFETIGSGGSIGRLTATVPAPGSMVALALSGLAAFRRRRQARSS